MRNFKNKTRVFWNVIIITYFIINPIIGYSSILNHFSDLNEDLTLDLDLLDFSIINNAKHESTNTHIDPIREFMIPIDSQMEETLKSSSLSMANFDNWWLDTIGVNDIDPQYDGTGIKVAVLDTGVFNHPDLDIANHSNFASEEGESNDYNDEYGHGTHCAGIISSNGAGSSGKYKGVAPGATIINAKIGGLSGGFIESEIIQAIEWCAKPIGDGGAGADIISMSFGVPDHDNNISAALSQAVLDYGVLCVASAGNSGPSYYTGSFPAYGPDVISVGATNYLDSLAPFSSLGPTYTYLGYPDVVAPGVDIISTSAYNSYMALENQYIGDMFDFTGTADYIPASGTSMAGPMVAGALAILKSKYNDITPTTARIALLEGARKLTNDKENDFLKSGAGLINVSASLEFLDLLNSTSNINNVSKIFPDSLPIKPFDLIHFPGDFQRFNLTILSGINNTYDLNISNDDGISISFNNDELIFSNAGVNFTTLDIRVEKDAVPGPRQLQLNIISGGQIFDSINISLDIRLPEYSILMDSYHGLNDWLLMETNNGSYSSSVVVPFHQMGFYEAMNEITMQNISIDYSMEYWTPDYDKNQNNSLLTEERLHQYDLVVLQNPILPYNPSEIDAIFNYFNDGGNLLILGTKYQSMCVENINHLLTVLNSSIQIKNENIMKINYLGSYYSLDTYDVTTFADSQIFQGVDKFYWEYGSIFDVSGDAESLATLNNKDVVAAYNGSEDGAGKIVAFGDLNWMYYDFLKTEYHSNHSALLTNLMEYYFNESNDPYSINIGLNSERITNSQFNISVYVKNQSSEMPLNSSLLISNLTVSISNNSILKPIDIISLDHGIAINTTFDLSNYFTPSYIPFTINVTLTIGSDIYNKVSKIIWINGSKAPIIEAFEFNMSNIDRGSMISINSTLNLDNCDVNGYMSVYTNSFHNNKRSYNNTLSFSNQTTEYGNITYINSTYPSGYAICYIVPKSNDNYTNPFSPRTFCQITNDDPLIDESISSITIEGYGTIKFDDTYDDVASTINLYPSSQGSSLDLTIYVTDSEGDTIRVFSNLFICALVDNSIVMIVPSTIDVSEISPVTNSLFTGSYKIPFEMSYSTLNGIKPISTVATAYNNYVGLLMITILDAEGGVEDFYIAFMIDATDIPPDPLLGMIVLIIILAVVGVVILGIWITRIRKKQQGISRSQYYQEYHRSNSDVQYYSPDDYYSEKSPVSPQESQKFHNFNCPFCGKPIDTPKKFCRHCGESLEFE